MGISFLQTYATYLISVHVLDERNCIRRVFLTKWQKQALIKFRSSLTMSVFFVWIRMLHVSERTNWKSSGRGRREDGL